MILALGEVPYIRVAFLEVETRVAVLGLTFKENIPDIRNSRMPDILSELSNFDIQASTSDPKVTAQDAMHEYGVTLVDWKSLENLDALVLAVPHAEFINNRDALFARLNPRGVLIDVKSAIDPSAVPKGLTYWSL